MNSGQRIVTIIDTKPEEFRKNLLSQKASNDYILYDNWELSSKNIDWIIGWGKLDSFVCSAENPNHFLFLDQWLNKHPDWRMGYINYDLKNQIEPSLCRKEKNTLSSDLIYFFVPEIVFIAKNNQIEAHYFPGTDIPVYVRSSDKTLFPSLNFSIQTDKDTYLQKISYLKGRIVAGDFYEINYCIEWQSDEPLDNAAAAYLGLQQSLQAPFSCYFQLDGIHLICNSPERFLKKSGCTLISQPIKGTSSRFAQADLDQQSRERLKNEKDLTENVMIVDLVRNDLSQVAEKGSVKVSELAETYTFPQVHQLISTIECRLAENVSFTDILKATFPMGSMTGAPKISAMNHAEETETMHRDIYSGTVGYITPEGDFDFNVVIRSLLHFSEKQKSYIRAGGAITIDSDPEAEWNECHLKAERLITFFNQ